MEKNIKTNGHGGARKGAGRKPGSKDNVTIKHLLEVLDVKSKGQSYEAMVGMHDDLMMNLVLFGWFAATPMFAESIDGSMREYIYAQQMKEIEGISGYFVRVGESTDDIEEMDFGQDPPYDEFHAFSALSFEADYILSKRDTNEEQNAQDANVAPTES